MCENDRVNNAKLVKWAVSVRVLFSGLLLLCFALGACVQSVDPTPTLTHEPVETTAVLIATPLPTVIPTSFPTATQIPSPTWPAASQPSPTTTLPPSATPDPYAQYSIKALAARAKGGGELEIVETLENNDQFARYLITYPSDGLTIYGFMNVPHDGTDFPVALVLHGYVPPEEYETVAYTRRYADALVEAGYLVIHPNFRNYPPSDSGPDAFRVGFAQDVLNLIAIIREQSQDPAGPLRRADADNIHLWGHSMGGGVALRVITVNNAAYMKAAVLYGSMSGDERLNYGRIQQWSNNTRGSFELNAPPEALAAISPIEHLDRITTPISIHHSYADERVPVEWSEDLCARLEARQHPVECFFYNDAPHTFIPPWDDLFIRRYVNFFENN